MLRNLKKISTSLFLFTKIIVQIVINLIKRFVITIFFSLTSFDRQKLISFLSFLFLSLLRSDVTYCSPLDSPTILPEGEVIAEDDVSCSKKEETPRPFWRSGAFWRQILTYTTIGVTICLFFFSFGSGPDGSNSVVDGVTSVLSTDMRSLGGSRVVLEGLSPVFNHLGATSITPTLVAGAIVTGANLMRAGAISRPTLFIDRLGDSSLTSVALVVGTVIASDPVAIQALLNFTPLELVSFIRYVGLIWTNMPAEERNLECFHTLINIWQPSAEIPVNGLVNDHIFETLGGENDLVDLDAD